MTLDEYLRELDTLGFDVSEGSCEHLEGYYVITCRACSQTFAADMSRYRYATAVSSGHPAIFLHAHRHPESSINDRHN